MSARALRAYKTVSVESAPPSKVLDELLGRMLRDIRDARACIVARDIVGRATAVDHALAIVGELAAAVDHDAAPELGDNLSRLWDFVGMQLSLASVNNDAAPLAEVEQIVDTLQASFAEAGQLR
jgi:flagellar biosynthetic protein FliS